MRSRRQVNLVIIALSILFTFTLLRVQYGRVEGSWNYLSGEDGQSHYGEEQIRVRPSQIEISSAETWATSIISTATFSSIVLEQSPLGAATSVSIATMFSHTLLPSVPLPMDHHLPDRAVVIGRLSSDDTSWVSKDLPHWQAAIYTFDQERDGTETTQGPISPSIVDLIMSNSTIRTLPNKGMEANPYLAYIVQNYDNLPSTVAFVHAHRDGYPEAWHTDSPGGGYSNVLSLQRLNIDFVQRNGYANLRCLASPGCNPPEVLPFRDPPEAHRTIEAAMPQAWRELFGNTDVPHELATPCCAQFAVSREQVLKKPLEEYRKYYRWLMESPLKDETSGRVFEYLWHVIFGQSPVYCPKLQKCYCDVYSQC